MNFDAAIAKGIPKAYQFLLFPNEGPLPVYEQDGSTLKPAGEFAVDRAIPATYEEIESGYVGAYLGGKYLYLSTSSLKLLPEKAPESYVEKLKERLAASGGERAEVKISRMDSRAEVMFRRVDDKHTRAEQFAYTVKDDTVTQIQPISVTSGVFAAAILVWAVAIFAGGVSVTFILRSFKRRFSRSKSS